MGSNRIGVPRHFGHMRNNRKTHWQWLTRGSQLQVGLPNTQLPFKGCWIVRKPKQKHSQGALVLISHEFLIGRSVIIPTCCLPLRKVKNAESACWASDPARELLSKDNLPISRVAPAVLSSWPSSAETLPQYSCCPTQHSCRVVSASPASQQISEMHEKWEFLVFMGEYSCFRHLFVGNIRTNL